MKFTSHSDDGVRYESHLRVESETTPGVSFTIRKISFGRRCELAREILALSQRAEFLEAGDGTRDQVEANVLAGEIERTYLAWGLVSVDGLSIDGDTATKETAIESGPESLTKEIGLAIRAQIGLSEEERKN